MFDRFGDIFVHIDDPESRVELRLHPEESVLAAAEAAIGRSAVEVR